MFIRGYLFNILVYLGCWWEVEGLVFKFIGIYLFCLFVCFSGGGIYISSLVEVGSEV